MRFKGQVDLFFCEFVNAWKANRKNTTFELVSWPFDGNLPLGGNAYSVAFAVTWAVAALVQQMHGDSNQRDREDQGPGREAVDGCRPGAELV